jgi:hypothetical protein
MIKYSIISNNNTNFLNKDEIKRHLSLLSEDDLYHRFGYKPSETFIENYINDLDKKLYLGVFAYDEENTIIGLCIIEEYKEQKELSISVLDKYTAKNNNFMIAQTMLEIVLNRCKTNNTSFDCLVELKNKKAFNFFKKYLKLDKIADGFFHLKYYADKQS